MAKESSWKNRIKKLQKMRKFKTQEEVFNKAGISERTYRNFLDGKPTSRDTLIRLADTFGVSVDYLLGRSNHLNVDDWAIHLQTGLSFKAIEKLREWKRSSNRFLPTDLAETVSLLIEQENDNPTLKSICDYLRVSLFGDFKLVFKGYGEHRIEELSTSLGEAIFSDGDISIQQFDVDFELNSIDLNEDFISQAQLLKVTYQLQEMRKEYAKKQKDEFNRIVDMAHDKYGDEEEEGEDDGEH